MLVLGCVFALQAFPNGPTNLRIQTCTASNNAVNNSFASACDNGTINYFLLFNDGLSETQTSNANTNQYGGVNVTQFNSSITNCQNITQVFLCYESWVSATTVRECTIKVDANGGGSFSLVNGSCPGTTADPGIICNNITSLESWTCANFFGTSGTRAIVQTQFARASGPGTRTMTTDVLFFNVTYDITPTAPNVTLISPTNGSVSYVNGVNFSCNTTSNTALTNITLYTNYSGTWQANGTTSITGLFNSTQFNRSGINDGIYSWNCYACNSGVCAFAPSNFSITVNALAPTINFTNPTEISGSYVNRRYIVVNVTANDSSLKNLSVLLFNSTRAQINRSNSTVSPLYVNFSVSSDGIYFFNATAYDNYNVSNFTETRNVTVDTINPNLNFSSNADSSGIYVRRGNIFVNVTISDTNIKNTTIFLFNSTFALINSNNNTINGSLSMNFTNLVNGTYYFNATSYDLAGNFNFTETRNVTIDTIVPNATLISPANASYVNNGTQNFTANLSDSLSGIKNTTLNIYNSTSLVNQTTTAYIGGVTSTIIGTVVTLVDNVYTWFYNLFDFAGNQFVSGNNTLTIDTLRPAVNLTYPLNTTYTINVSALNYTIFDINLQACWYSLNGGSTNTSVTCGANLTSLTSNEGTNTLVIYGNDSAGNLNLSSVTFFKDSINPSIGFVSPTEISGSYANKNFVLINVTASDTNFANVTINLYNSTMAQINSSNSTLSPLYSNFSSLSDGIYYFNASSRDLANNVNYTETRNITLDRTNPLIVNGTGTLSQGVNVSQNYIYFNVSVTEINEANITFRLYNSTSLVNQTTNVAGTRTINWTNLPNGVYTYNATARDLANNFNTTITRTITLDTNAPSGVLSSPANATYSNISSQNFTANLTDNLGIRNATLNIYNSTSLVNQTTTAYVGGVTGTIIGTVVTLVDNVYNWFYSLFDWAGNNYLTGNNTLTVDTVNPEINFTNPTPVSGVITSTNSIFVNLSESDINQFYSFVNLDNSLQSYWKLESGNGTFFVDDSGKNNGSCFGVQCPITTTLGKFGRAYIFDSVNNFIDAGIASTLNFAGAANDYSFSTWIKIAGNGSEGSSVTILGKSSGGSGYRLSHFNDAQGLYFQSNGNNFTSNYQLGLNSWYHVVYTKNLTGQYFFVNGVQVANDSVDTLSTSASNFYIGTYVSPPTSLFNGSIDEVLVFNRSLSSNEILSLYDSGINNYFNSFTDLGDGLHTFMGYSVDLAGNKNQTETRNLTIDTLNPLINFTEPTEISGSYANKNFVLINVTASDANFANVTINLYNSTMAQINSSNSTLSPLYSNFSVSSDGIYYFNASSRDLTNNVNFTETRNITLDRTNPLIVNGTGTLDSGVNVSQNFIYFNVSVTEINEANITFRLYNSTLLVNQTTNVAGTRIINWTNLPNGVYTYNATVTDKVNLQNTTLIRSITLDRTAPNASLIAPANASYSNTSSNNFTANLSDSLSRIINATLNIYNSTSLVNQTTTAYIGGVTSTIIGTVVTLVDNVYNWFYSLFDFAGNNFVSGNNTLTIDTLRPAANLTYPLNTTYTINVSALNYTISDINLQACWYSLNGGSTNTSVTCGANLTSLTSNEGTNTWVIYGNDSAGNVNLSSVTFFKDSINPSIGFVSPTEISGSYANKNFVLINVTASDANFANVTINLYNSTMAQINSSNSTLSPLYSNFSVSSDGIYYFNASSRDLTNNVNFTETRNITLDRTNPLIVNGTGTLDSGVNVSQNFIYFNVSVTEINEANITFRLYNSTSLVNQTTNVAGTRTINWTNLPNGVYTYNATVTDKVNLQNTTLIRSITLDRTSPNATLSSPANASYVNNGTQNFTANLSDSLSGIQNATLNIYNSTSLVNQTTTAYIGGVTSTIIGTVVTLVDNVYNWFYSLFDFAGNNFVSGNNTLTIDTLRPAVFDFNPIAGTTYNISDIIQISTNVTDSSPISYVYAIITFSNSTIQNTTLTSFGGNKYNSTFTVPNLIGIFNVSFFANDSAGNINNTSNTSFIVNDNIFPIGNFISPTPINGSTQSLNTTFFNVSITDNLAVGSCLLEFDGVNESMTLIGSGISASCNLTKTQVPDGWHNFTVSFNDSSGNLIRTEIRTYLVDRNAPNVQFANPTEIDSSYITRTNIVINVTAISLSSLENITIFLYNSTSLVNITTIATSPNFINITNLPNEHYTFNATATDTLNRIGLSENRNVTIDTINPLISLGIGILPSGVNVSQSYIYFNVSVTETNEANITFRLYNSTSNVNTTTYSTAVRSINWTNLPNGVYTYNATIFDKVNLQNTTLIRTITLDANAPNATLIAPLNASYINNATHNFTANLTDNLGIRNATLNIYNLTALVNQTTTSFAVGTISTSLGVVVTLIDDVYTWFYNLFDFTGNQFVSENNTLTIDTLYPTIQFVSPTEIAGSYIFRNNILINVSSFDNNFDRLEVYVYDGLFNYVNVSTFYSEPFFLNITGLSDDTYTFEAATYDLTTKLNATDQINVTIDTTSPFVDYGVGTSLNGTTLSLTNIYVNITVNETNEANVTFRLYNSTSLVNLTNSISGTRTINWIDLPNGVYTYNATIVDKVNLQNTTLTRTILLDTTLPSVNFVSPTEDNGTYSNKNYILINATSSSSNLANITINLYNSTNLLNSSTTSTISNYVNISGLSEGIYYFNATVRNFANALGYSETRIFILDTTNPLIVNGTGTLASGVNVSQNYIYFNVSVTEINEANITFRLYNSTSLVNQTTNVAGTRTINWTNLPDGVYTYNATARDLANNLNTTLTRTITLDTSVPNATLIAPVNATYSNSSSNNFTANLSDSLSGIQNATLNIYNSTSLVNQTTTSFTGVTSTIIGTVVTLIDNVYNWFYTLFDFAGNSFTSGNNTLTVDTTYPLISFGEGTAINGFASSNLNIYVNVSVIENNEANITFRLYNSTSNVNTTTYSTSVRSINWTNLAVGSYSYNVSITDLAGNNNLTQTRTITLGNIPPIIENIGYSPNASDGLDPNSNITFSVNVNSTIGLGVNTVILQYNFGSGWLNVTMANITLNTYQANLTLIGTEATYLFRIFANDSINNYNQSLTYNFTSYWDCSWVLDKSTLGAFSGFNESKFLDTILINNTGDIQYSNNNCTLNFRLNHALTSGRILFDNSALKPSNTYAITAKNTTSINISATFLSTFADELFDITVEETDLRSSTANRNVSLDLVSTTGNQPYLYQTITSAPSTIFLKLQDASLFAYVKNLVGDGSLAKSAYNVSFNWSLPATFLIGAGNINQFYSIILDNLEHHNDIQIAFNSTNLPSMTPGNYTLYLYSSGLNSSGSKVVMANNKTLLMESINITLSCYDGKDGIIVSACGLLDGDAVPTAVVTVTTTTASGGGGGGSIVGGGGVSSPSYEETIEVLRGEANSFEIEIKNKYLNFTMKNLKLIVSGYPAKYITIVPSQINELAPGQSYKFKVTVTSPTYTDYQELPLVGTISGSLVSSDGSKVSYSEQHNVLLILTEVTKDQASNKIDIAQKAIEELKAKGYNTIALEKELANAKNYLDDKKYKSAKTLAEKVLSLKQKSEDTNNLIRRVLTAAKDPKLNKLLVGDVTLAFDNEDNSPLRELFSRFSLFTSNEVKDTLDLAIAAFERGDYLLAEERANNALKMLMLERKGSPLLFIYLYWQYLLLGLVLASLMGIVGYRRIRVLNINSRIRDSIVEEDNLMRLSKQNQESYFKKNLSPVDYRARRNDYDERRAKLKQIRVQLRNKRINLLKAEEIIPNLDKEKNNIEKEIKTLQEEFYKRGKISKEEYEKEFAEFNDRVAEIEDERVTLQVIKRKHDKKSFFHHIKAFFGKQTLKKDENVRIKLDGALKKDAKI